MPFQKLNPWAWHVHGRRQASPKIVAQRGTAENDGPAEQPRTRATPNSPGGAASSAQWREPGRTQNEYTAWLAEHPLALRSALSPVARQFRQPVDPESPDPFHPRRRVRYAIEEAGEREAIPPRRHGPARPASHRKSNAATTPLSQTVSGHGTWYRSCAFGNDRHRRRLNKTSFDVRRALVAHPDNGSCAAERRGWLQNHGTAGYPHRRLPSVGRSGHERDPR